MIEVPPTAYSNPAHYVHTSRRIAEETPNALWSNQFDQARQAEPLGMVRALHIVVCVRPELLFDLFFPLVH